MPVLASSEAGSIRSLQNRRAAQIKWSRHDPVEGTRAAREKFLGRFVDEVDPNRTLPEEERIRRAESAKRAYFLGLAIKSAQARRSRKAIDAA